MNKALEQHQSAERVDHRSFERQGRKEEPTQHMGVSATAMERQVVRKAERYEPVTERGKMNAAIRRRNNVLDIARKTVETAQVGLHKLKKRAQPVTNLARKIGQKKETDHQRQEPIYRKKIDHQQRNQSLDKDNIINNNYTL